MLSYLPLLLGGAFLLWWLDRFTEPRVDLADHSYFFGPWED